MREQILTGVLAVPALDQVAELYGVESAEWYDRFWSAMWNRTLSNPTGDNTTSMFYWRDNCPNSECYYEVVQALQINGWCVTNIRPNDHWASIGINVKKLLEYITEAELLELSVQYKKHKYTLDIRSSTATDKVKVGRTIKSTGLVREGFAKAGNTQFGYDTAMMQKYHDVLSRNLTKGMEKVRAARPNMKTEHNDYDVISLQVLDNHINNPLATYTTGTNINDSRGRAISQGLKKVFNPIGNKDARALLVITYE